MWLCGYFLGFVKKLGPFSSDCHRFISSPKYHYAKENHLCKTFMLYNTAVFLCVLLGSDFMSQSWISCNRIVLFSFYRVLWPVLAVLLCCKTQCAENIHLGEIHFPLSFPQFKRKKVLCVLEKKKQPKTKSNKTKATENVSSKVQNILRLQKNKLISVLRSCGLSW